MQKVRSHPSFNGPRSARADVLPKAIEGRRLSLLARLDPNERLGRNDEAAGKSADQDFAGHAKMRSRPSLWTPIRPRATLR